MDAVRAVAASAPRWLSGAAIRSARKKVRKQVAWPVRTSPASRSPPESWLNRPDDRSPEFAVAMRQRGNGALGNTLLTLPDGSRRGQTALREQGSPLPHRDGELNRPDDRSPEFAVAMRQRGNGALGTPCSLFPAAQFGRGFRPGRTVSRGALGERHPRGFGEVSSATLGPPRVAINPRPAPFPPTAENAHMLDSPSVLLRCCCYVPRGLQADGAIVAPC